VNKVSLVQQLNSIENAKRVSRLRVADLVLENSILFKHLLEIVFDIDNKLSIKAAWVLEFVCVEKLEWLAPQLNYFTKNIGKLKFGSAIRPIAKICELLAKEYISNNDSVIKNSLTKEHINVLIEVGFNWLIGKQKVAVKAYTMEMLFLVGKNHDWVHEELQLIIQQNISLESAAYKARGKKVLSWINNK